MPPSYNALLTIAGLLIAPSQFVHAQNYIPLGHQALNLHPRADNTTEIQTSAKSKSTSTFLTALWTNAAIFVAQLLAFSVLRKYFKEVYEPRTYVPKKEKRSPPLGSSLFSWPWKIWKADFGSVLYQNGVDAYLFVRFHRMMVLIFLPIWIVSWSVLLPVTGVDGGGKNTGLDQLTFGNIGQHNQERYWAHLACAYVFTMWICGMIYFESLLFIDVRHEYLTNERHARSPQAKTILITGIDDDYLEKRRLKALFSHLPGGIDEIWINRDLKDVPDIYKRRLKACDILEKAETKLVETAMKLRMKEQDESSAEKSRKKHEDDESSRSSAERGQLSLAERLVPKRDWPKRRLPLGPLPFAIPLLSKKVDAIDRAREEIIETTRLLKKKQDLMQRRGRRRHKERRSGNRVADSAGDTYPFLNSAFIQFKRQVSAHLAAQALVHHQPFKMTKKYIEVAPADIIWSNLGIKPQQMRIRTAIGYFITAALIILWSIPVAFIGATSNVSSLCKTYSWLAWLCDAPHFVIGLVQGVLPAVLLAALMALLPRVLRRLAKFEGVPRRTEMELSLMTRYFMFLVIHSFLIVTLSAGLIAALPELLEDPTSIPSLLAHELPQASNFFLTYITLQGLSGTGMGFLQVGYFITYYLKLCMAGSTPRSLAKVKYRLKFAKLGESFPETTLLVVISIAYMIISPIINGLAVATFFLFFEMYKYRFLYQLGQPVASDTGGLFFPRAIQQVFVGIYIQQICLCSLFILARNKNNEPSNTVQIVLMIILIVFTATYHSALNGSYGPLTRALPLTRAEGVSEARMSPSKRWSWLRGYGARFEPNVDGRPAEFLHPALGENRPIWIPKDTMELGISESEVKENRRGGIQAGCHNAKMTEKGKVLVYGHPPEGPDAIW